MEEKKFNQIEYINEYRKKHKAQFNVDLKKEEKEEIDIFLKRHNINKAEFVRNAFKLFKEKIENEEKLHNNQN